MVFTISSEQFRVAIKEATISGDNSYRPTLYTSHGLALGSPCSPRGLKKCEIPRQGLGGERWLAVKINGRRSLWGSCACPFRHFFLSLFFRSLSLSLSLYFLYSLPFLTLCSGALSSLLPVG